MKPSRTSLAPHPSSARVRRHSAGRIVAPGQRHCDWQHPDLMLVVVVLSFCSLLAIASHELGANTHSLISLGATAFLVWHVATQRRWIRGVAKRRAAHPQKTLISVNAALVLCLAFVTVSGVLVWFWEMPSIVYVSHGMSSVLFLALATVHTAFKGKRLVRRLRGLHRAQSRLACDITPAPSRSGMP